MGRLKLICEAAAHGSSRVTSGLRGGAVLRVRRASGSSVVLRLGVAGLARGSVPGGLGASGSPGCGVCRTRLKN